MLTFSRWDGATVTLAPLGLIKLGVRSPEADLNLTYKSPS